MYLVHMYLYFYLSVLEYAISRDNSRESVLYLLDRFFPFICVVITVTGNNVCLRTDMCLIRGLMAIDTLLHLLILP